MVLRLEYNFPDTLKFGSDMLPAERVRFLAPVMDIGLARFEAETITVGPMMLVHFALLSQADPDAVVIWDTADQNEYPYLIEHQGQVGEYKGYPLILDALMDEDAPIILNGVKDGTMEFINVDIKSFI